MGYSDNTNLHLYLWNLRIVSLYGGAIMIQFAIGGGMHEYTINSIEKAIFTSQIGQIKAASEYSDVDLDWEDKQNLNKERPVYSSFNMNFGHTDPQIIIPSGGMVLIDGNAKTIHFT